MQAPDEIKIGNIIFKNERIYSKFDNIRDKGFYIANVNGLKITIGNSNPYKEGFYFSCDALSIKEKFFVSKDLAWDLVAKNTINFIKAHLQKTLELL